MSVEEKRIDLKERDLRIAVTQAQGNTDALRIAEKRLQEYLVQRLALQLQSTRMKMAASQVDAAGYTLKGAKDD